jgi:hypothetical protein
MLICPTCRNQNLDTAKFCGNCGNSFTRPSASTASLINCAQGHVYSAVYEHCPYCPQPQYESPDLDFATRVETPVTTIDPPLGTGPATYAHSQNTDFVTRIDTRENVFETIESAALPPPPSAPLPPTPAFVHTEITPTVPPSEAFGSATAEPFRISGTTESPALNQESRNSQTQDPQTVPSTLDRRTMMLSDQSSPLRKSKGRIVGWLVTYSHNPDGDDFRIYAGYNRIGANPVCDVQVEDETVSGSHAIIVYRDGRCLIKDDLSRNGTFVNGREITEAQPLQSYDQVRVGNTTLIFVPAQHIE